MGAKKVFSVTIGDKKVFSKTNSKPVEVTDLKVYSGSPWYTNQKGFLHKLKIDIKTPIYCIVAGFIYRGERIIRYSNNIRILFD